MAVKTLQSDSSEDREAFFREINLMKTLHHPNIVSFLGFCEESSGELVAPPLIVLEYMALGDLLNLLIANRYCLCVALTTASPHSYCTSLGSINAALTETEQGKLSPRCNSYIY